MDNGLPSGLPLSSNRHPCATPGRRALCCVLKFCASWSAGQLVPEFMDMDAGWGKAAGGFPSERQKVEQIKHMIVIKMP